MPGQSSLRPIPSGARIATRRGLWHSRDQAQELPSDTCLVVRRGSAWRSAAAPPHAPGWGGTWKRVTLETRRGAGEPIRPRARAPGTAASPAWPGLAPSAAGRGGAERSDPGPRRPPARHLRCLLRLGHRRPPPRPGQQRGLARPPARRGPPLGGRSDERPPPGGCSDSPAPRRDPPPPRPGLHLLHGLPPLPTGVGDIGVHVAAAAAARPGRRLAQRPTRSEPRRPQEGAQVTRGCSPGRRCGGGRGFPAPPARAEGGSDLPAAAWHCPAALPSAGSPRCNRRLVSSRPAPPRRRLPRPR